MIKMRGIIAPTHLEADLIVQQLHELETLIIQGKNFYKGILNNHPTIVCICGIGKTNAAHGATLLIETFRTTHIYIIGVAGAYPSSALSVGDIVIAEKEIYGDEGLAIKSGESETIYVMDYLCLPLATISGINYYNEFPMAIPDVFLNLQAVIRGLKSKFLTGNFVTISACTGTLKKGREIEQKFDAICENMEGAAVAHVCAFSGIPVTEIRGISNIIEDRKPEPLDKSNIFKAAECVQRAFLSAIR